MQKHDSKGRLLLFQPTTAPPLMVRETPVSFTSQQQQETRPFVQKEEEEPLPLATKSLPIDYEPDEASGRESAMNWTLGLITFGAILMVMAGAFCAASASRAPTLPLIQPGGLLFSWTALAGDAYLLLTKAGFRQLDLTELPSVLNNGSVSQILPSAANASCLNMESLHGDLAVPADRLIMITTGSEGDVVSLTAPDPAPKFVPLKVVSAIASLAMGAAHIGVLTWFWIVTTVGQGKTLPFIQHADAFLKATRHLAGFCFMVLSAMGTLVTIHLMGGIMRPVAAMFFLASLCYGVAIWRILARNDNVVYGRGSGDGTDAILCFALKTQGLRTLAWVVLCITVQMAMVGSWATNYQLDNVLTDWQPLYTPRPSSLSQATVWVLGSGQLFCLLVMFIPILWIDGARIDHKFVLSPPVTRLTTLTSRSLRVSSFFTCAICLVATAVFLAIASITTASENFVC